MWKSIVLVISFSGPNLLLLFLRAGVATFGINFTVFFCAGSYERVAAFSSFEGKSFFFIFFPSKLPEAPRGDKWQSGVEGAKKLFG